MKLLSLLALLLACTDPDAGRGDVVPSPDDGASDDGASDDGASDDGATDGETAPTSAFDGFETFAYAKWVENPGDRDCVLRWTTTGTAVDPATTRCDGCTAAWEVTLTYDDAGSTGREKCSQKAVDRTLTYNYHPGWKDKGPSLVVTDGRVAFWWAFASLEGDQLRWWFGQEDWQQTEYDEFEPEQYLRYVTQYSEGRATVALP